MKRNNHLPVAPQVSQ